MAVIPNQQTPNPYYVKPYNPNSSTATPSPTTPNPVGGQRVGNLSDAVNADGSPYQWSGGTTPQPGQYSSPSMPNTSYSRQTPQMSTQSNSVAVPQWNVNDPNFLNKSADERLKIFGSTPDLARQEILRDKTVYGTASSSGNMAGANAAHSWADQVRSVAGIPNEDATYGNGNGTTPNYTDGSAYANHNFPTIPNTFKSPWTIDPTQAAQAAKEQAAAKFRQMLDAGKNAWQTGIVGAKNAFDYTNKITGDNRVLRNEQFKENNSPFSGKFQYDKTNMLRNDDIQDTASNADYNNKVNSLNQTWADLQSAAPGQEQALYDQLYQQAAALGIQADQLNLQGNQQAFNQFDANRKFDYGASQDTVKNGQWDKTFNYNAGQDALKNQQWQQKFEQDAKVYGQDYALKKLMEENNLTMQQAQLAVSQRNAATSEANAGSSASNAKINQLMDVWKNTGKAPAGIPGVAEGTDIYKAPSAGSSNNQTEAQLVGAIDQMDDSNRKRFFTEQKQNIINEHGLTYYNKIYKQYYDVNGNPVGG